MRGGKDRKDSAPSQVVVSPRPKQLSPKWALWAVGVFLLAGLGFVTYDQLTNNSKNADEPQTAEINSLDTLKNTELSEDIPDDGKISFYLGTANALQTQGRLGDAKQMLDKAASINADDEQVNRGFAKFYALVGDAENRQKYEDRAGSSVPDVPSSETDRVCKLSEEYKCP